MRKAHPRDALRAAARPVHQQARSCCSTRASRRYATLSHRDQGEGWTCYTSSDRPSSTERSQCEDPFSRCHDDLAASGFRDMGQLVAQEPRTSAVRPPPGCLASQQPRLPVGLGSAACRRIAGPRSDMGRGNRQKGRGLTATGNREPPSTSRQRSEIRRHQGRSARSFAREAIET